MSGMADTPFDIAPQDAFALLHRHAEVLQLVARGVPLQEVLDSIIVALEELIPGAYCSILLLDRSGTTLHHGAAPHLRLEYLRDIDGLRVGPLAGSCGSAAHFNTRVIAEDVRDDARWTEFRASAVHAGLVACWSTPIAGHSGDPVGTFAVYHREPHRPSHRELRLVDRFTQLASVAIEHSKLVGNLVDSEELFRRSFEDNAVGMALIDLDGTVLRINRAMTKLTGFTEEQLIGQSIAVLFEPSDESEVAAFSVTLSHHHDERVTRQTRLKHDDGRFLPVEATSSLVRGIDGEPRLMALNLLDLTARSSAERAVRERREAEVARRTAEEHGRAKSELLTAVSHEIRTPLQAITGFTELLSTLDLDGARRKEALTQINRAAKHLLDIVTDVLDISRVEAAVLPLQIESVRVSEAVRDAIDLIGPEASARNVDLYAQTESRLTVLADRRRLVQIMLNLIGNAVRHGSDGGRVEVIGRADGDTIELRVDDDGPGIPAGLLPHLFTPFYRGTAADVDGYGLGLVLASGLASAMGGELSAQNIPDRGASFRLRLPRPQGEDM
ncbi:ATP-binding protein [Streptomyces sp. NPDC005474]|uniref:ATP-binding protein n=1 Tax=Streptomyces sp. NPDC005474 TaxID=3154878 RepID=UPI0034517BE1